jgi:hypothetical protein
MRKGTQSHFVGSLYSSQVIYAYAAADGITTILWISFGWLGLVDDITTTATLIQRSIEIYITGLLPVFIPPYTIGSVVFILSNCVFTVAVLGWWSAKFGWSG